jgi:hypothetical protein
MLIMSVLIVDKRKLIALRISRDLSRDGMNKKRESNIDPPLKSNTQNIY